MNSTKMRFFAYGSYGALCGKALRSGQRPRSETRLPRVLKGNGGSGPQRKIKVCRLAEFLCFSPSTMQFSELHLCLILLLCPDIFRHPAVGYPLTIHMTPSTERTGETNFEVVQDAMVVISGNCISCTITIHLRIWLNLRKSLSDFVQALQRSIELTFEMALKAKGNDRD